MAFEYMEGHWKAADPEQCTHSFFPVHSCSFPAGSPLFQILEYRFLSGWCKHTAFFHRKEMLTKYPILSWMLWEIKVTERTRPKAHMQTHGQHSDKSLGHVSLTQTVSLDRFTWFDLVLVSWPFSVFTCVYISAKKKEKKPCILVNNNKIKIIKKNPQ